VTALFAPYAAEVHGNEGLCSAFSGQAFFRIAELGHFCDRLALADIAKIEWNGTPHAGDLVAEAAVLQVRGRSSKPAESRAARLKTSTPKTPRGILAPLLFGLPPLQIGRCVVPLKTAEDGPNHRNTEFAEPVPQLDHLVYSAYVLTCDDH
jgi:hypothetical protein